MEFLTVQPDMFGHIVAANTEAPVFVIVPLEWVQEVNRYVNAAKLAEMRPDHPELLQAKADDNRANAHTRFPELRKVGESWYDADGDSVMFTPHGYRKTAEVMEEMSRE